MNNLANFLLNNQSAVKTFDAISLSFQKTFSKTDHFKLGRILVSLLDNDLLPDNIPRIISLFLLWDMHKSEPIECNPFLPFMLSFFQRDGVISQYSLPPAAKDFIYSLMRYSDRARDLFRTTPVQLLDGTQDMSTPHSCDWSYFEPQLQEHLQRIPKIDLCGIPCILPDEDVVSIAFDRASVSGKQRRQCVEDLLGCGGLWPASMQCLQPEFLRLAPPLLTCPQAAMAGIQFSDNPIYSPPDSDWAEELIWLSPTTVDHQFHWDSSMGHSSPTFELRQLMSVALTSTLTQTQRVTLVHAIKEYGNMIQSFGLTAENFPDLVNRNPIVAIEVLLGLYTTPDVDMFLTALSDMDVTLHSMDVFNQIVARMKLTSEFIHTFISSCIAGCQSTADKFMQMRLVRLVCVVIQAVSPHIKVLLIGGIKCHARTF